MPVANIVDKRTNKYDVVCEIIYEPSCQDNKCKGATQFERHDHVFYEELPKGTIAEAIKHCEQYEGGITLYLYDLETNCGPNAKLHTFDKDGKRVELGRKGDIAKGVTGRTKL